MFPEGTLHKKYKISLSLNRVDEPSHGRSSSLNRITRSLLTSPQQPTQPEDDCSSSLSSRISSDIDSCLRLRPNLLDCSCSQTMDSVNENHNDMLPSCPPWPRSSHPNPSANSCTRKFGRRRQRRPDTVKKVRVRNSTSQRTFNTPTRRSTTSLALVLFTTLLVLLHPTRVATVLLDPNGDGTGPAGAPVQVFGGDGFGSLNLEKSIAAVFSRVAYGSTTTTKRSIPDNVYVPSLTTVSTPLLTTFSANHRNYELDLERDHVLPTSAPNAEILKSNSNPTYPNPNRHHGHDRHRHSNSTPYPHGHNKKGFPTNPMGDIPSYSPPSRTFFTPPLPRNYTNPFADKPTLRGTNSDSTIISTGSYVNRRPLPPPSLMPGHERIPIRPDLNGSVNPQKPAIPQDPMVGLNVGGGPPSSSSQSIDAQRKKALNTPSEKSNKLDSAKGYGVDSKFMLDGNANSSAILPNGMHFPSISRILSGSNGRTQTIPDVLLRSVTSAPRPNQPTFDLNPPVTSLSNSKSLNKGNDRNDGVDDEGDFDGGGDSARDQDDEDDEEDEDDVVAEKEGSAYSTQAQSVQTSTVSSLVHLSSSSSPITQKMPNLNLKSVMIKANTSGEEGQLGNGYGNDRNFASDIEDYSTWTIAWNIHVYLSAILFTILAVYSIFKIIFYDKLTHLFSQSYFISIHLILIIICLLRIFYLCYDAYNLHLSFNLFTSELLLNLPLTFLTTTFAILILFLLLRSINHKTNRYSSILRPLTIMIGSGVHVGLCITLHLVESYETQQFYHKQAQLLATARGGKIGHGPGPTNIQIPPRVLSLICQIIYIFICLSLGILYLYMYRLLKRILHKSQNYIHGYNNLSYAIHITIATALLFILLAALQIYGAISISSQTKVKLSPNNKLNDNSAKKTFWASHMDIDWFQWGYQFSLRFIEIVIIALLSWVTGLKTGTSKVIQREKDMEQPNASGFALFPCTSSSSQENFETDYPAVCNANTNLHTYTLRTGKPIYDDNFALNSLNLEQNSNQDLQLGPGGGDFQRSIETNSMRSSSHNYSNNYNGSQQAEQHDDFMNDSEQMPDHYENPNFELKHHHRGEPRDGPQYHDIMDNCYSEPINAPPYDTKSLRGAAGGPPVHIQQGPRNYDFQNFERPSFDQAASSQSISRGEFRASKNLKTLKSGQANYDANTVGHHHYNHFNNYNDSFERRIGVRKSGTLNNIGGMHFNQHVGGSGRNNNNSTSSASSSASSNNRGAIQQQQQVQGRPPRGIGPERHLNGAQTLSSAGRGVPDHHHHHHHHPQAAPRNLPGGELVHPGSFNDRLVNGGGFVTGAELSSQDNINNFDDNSSSASYYHSKKRSRESSSSSYTGFNNNGSDHGPPNQDPGSSSPTVSGSNVPINGLGGSSSGGSSSGVLPGKMGPAAVAAATSSSGAGGEGGDSSTMLVAEQGFVRFRALEDPTLGSRTNIRDKNKLFMNS
ncbi:AAEL008894-PA [Aedes aegypti]|uniref:AAEL008894-PA n=1 Tax=Aedes aegypti TaxID=7159 RepID=Q16XE2_AEDAE|nr:AAEL008894-PA [Aedes aegypti]